jgi:ABC-2 type transport system permease protein
MSTATLLEAPTPTVARRPAEPHSRLTDVWVMVRRNLAHVSREPMQLSDATVQPVLFTLLFVYVFGGSMVLPGGGAYKQFAIGGLLAMNLTTSAVGTAVGLTTDLSTGVLDRFRTLPMWHGSVLVGRTLADLLAAMLCSTFVVLTGLAIGWRPDGPVQVLGGVLVAITFSYALSWACACLGLISESPEAAQAVAFLVIFPMAFLSNAFSPTQGMPSWLRPLAEWNPVSALATACRSIFGDPNPGSLSSAWPMQHPVAASLGWSALFVAVFAPLSVHLLRRRLTD